MSTKDCKAPVTVRDIWFGVFMLAYRSHIITRQVAASSMHEVSMCDNEVSSTNS